MSSDCYMCDAEAVGREHVPPQCFFPAGHRKNLVTVPSCDTHNSNNSKDVEYVRNVLAFLSETNELASEVLETAKRSFDRSEALFNQTFRGLRPVQVEGGETGAFPIDLPRLQRVMKAIAYAVYFHDYGKKHDGDWRIFTPSLRHARELYDGQPDPWEGLRKYLESGSLTPMPVAEPRVFRYGVLQLERPQLLYRFEFYEAFTVNAWTLFQTYVSFGGR